MRGEKKYLGIVLVVLSIVFILAASQGNSSSEVHIDGLRILYNTFNGATTEFSNFNETGFPSR